MRTPNWLAKYRVVSRHLPPVGWRLVTPGTPGTINLTNNSLYFGSIVVPQRMTFDLLEIEVTAAGLAGSLVRAGVYTENPEGGPGALVTEWGTIAVDTTGVRSLPISWSPNTGTYYLALRAEALGAGTPTVRTRGGTGSIHPVFPAAAYSGNCMHANNTDPTLPASAPAPNLLTQSNFPVVGLRRA